MLYIVYNTEIEQIVSINQKLENVFIFTKFPNNTFTVVIPSHTGNVSNEEAKQLAEYIQRETYSSLEFDLYLRYTLEYYDCLITESFNKLLKEKDYDSIVSCLSYLNDPNPKFRSEAKYIQKMRSDIYTTADNIRTEILNGTRAVPTIEEFMELMPNLTWDDVVYE